MEDLTFLEELAKENNIEYFYNDKDDLEIKDKKTVFHLADLLSGEKDAVKRWDEYANNDIRCVFVYPPYLKNPNRVNVYKNILLYQCGKVRKIFARNTVVKKYPAIEFKWFFEQNNIEGYRNAKTVYVLEDKKTNQPYMCYSIGAAYFGKGKYDCEIARGASLLGTQTVGGASKLWKHIIADNPDIKSIVYYVDRREYQKKSISHLMDSEAMSGEGKVYEVKGCPSFMNYWVEDVNHPDGSHWHDKGDYSNREASRNSEVVAAYHNGSCLQVKNPGSFTNIFVRKGYYMNSKGEIVSEDK